MNDLSVLLILKRIGFATRRNNIGGSAVSRIARRQTDIASVIQCVVVCHRIRTSDVHEHALVRLPGVIPSGKRLKRDRRRVFKICVFLNHLPLRVAKLGRRHAVGDRVLFDLPSCCVFVCGTRNFEEVTDFRVRTLCDAAHVNEDAVRGVAFLLRRTTRSWSLDVEAALAAVRCVNRGNHAASGYVLPFKRRGVAGALDLSDRGDLARLRLLRLGRRICRILRGWVNGRLAGIARVLRCRLRDNEVDCVVVGVDTDILSLNRRGVCSPLGRGRLGSFGGCAPADQVCYLAVVVNQLGDCSLCAEVERTNKVSLREILRLFVVLAVPLDEEEAFRGDLSRELNGVTGISVCGLLVKLPTADVNLSVGRVVKLNEIVVELAACVAATAVHLVDDDVGAVHRCIGSRCDDGDGTCCQRDCERGAEALAGSGHGYLSETQGETVDGKNKLAVFLSLSLARS